MVAEVELAVDVALDQRDAPLGHQLHQRALARLGGDRRRVEAHRLGRRLQQGLGECELDRPLAALDVAGKATTGEWECEPVDVFGTLTEWAALIGPRRPGSDWPRKSDLRHEDAVAIVAMHNAAPAIAELCAEVERLRAERDSARDSMATAHVTAAQVGDELIATRAKLAEAKRLGMEACGIGRACVKADCECRIGAIRAALEAL